MTNKTTEPAAPEPLGDSEGTATQVVAGLAPDRGLLGRIDDLQNELAAITQERDKANVYPPEPLRWLYSHCTAIGMTCKSDSGRWEHDIALFTINQKNQLTASQAENEALRKDAERWRFFRIADWADWNAVFRVDHDGLSLPELLDKATDAAMKG